MNRVSSLLCPVVLEGDTIRVLDETLLPHREVYLAVHTIEEAQRVLKNMNTRALGQVLLFFYSCLLFKEQFSIEEIVERFRAMRPTFDFPLLGQLIRRGLRQQKNMNSVIESFINDFDKARRQRAEVLATLLPQEAHILTICNVNGELIYLYEALKKIGKSAFFYVCETRPYLQGTRLTFWELRRNNIDCKLICINQAAPLMRDGYINCVVTGADRATEKGDIINKIGTYSLARLAHYFKIPFYPLVQYPKDVDVDTIPIEQRPKQEVFMFLEGNFNDIEAVYPSFDVTSFGFVTKCVELPL